MYLIHLFEQESQKVQIGFNHWIICISANSAGSHFVTKRHVILCTMKLQCLNIILLMCHFLDYGEKGKLRVTYHFFLCKYQLVYYRSWPHGAIKFFPTINMKLLVKLKMNKNANRDGGTTALYKLLTRFIVFKLPLLTQ